MNAAKFLENSNSATGDKIALPKAESAVTKSRRKGFATLRKIASAKGDTDLQVAETVLRGAPAELATYIQSKGITPSGQAAQMIAQAALLRLKDIGQTSLIFNTTDGDSLKELEEAETVAIQTGSAAADNVLNPQVQAALLVVIDEILRRSKKANGVGTARSFVKGLSGNSKGSGDYDSNFNINNLLVQGAANYATGDVPQTATGAQSVQDWINIAVNAFSTVVAAFKKGGAEVSDTINQVKDSVKGGASDIGADSLGKFFDKYKWWFIGALVIILVIVLIAVYAKRK